jgi:multicomponent Na+:H+ antiporter subunit D
MLNIGYFAPVVYRAFFAAPMGGKSGEGLREAPLLMVIPLCCTALVSILIGICPDFLMNFVKGVMG